MLKNNSWVSSKLVKDVLFICGNPSPTTNQCELMTDLLDYVMINPGTKGIHLLSERERTCLFWIAHGKSTEEMAPLMRVKLSTIQTYRNRIRKKLRCQTLAQAVFLTMCYQPKEVFH